MEFINRYFWNIVFGAALLLQAVVSVISFKMIADLGVMSGFAQVLMGLELAVVFAVTAVLLLIRPRKFTHKRIKTLRIIGCAAAVIVSAVMIFVSMFAAKLNQTVAVVTDQNKIIATMMNVYVMADNSAQDISEAVDYRFAIMKTLDRSNTDTAAEELSGTLGKENNFQEFVSVQEAFHALYAGEADAVLINEAYTDILDESEEFQNFKKDTRVLYEIPIYSELSSGRSDASRQADPTRPEPAPVITDEGIRPFIVYISGSDTRKKVLTTSRSDVNILMVVNPSTSRILLVNTPRDYYVGNPAGEGALDKLTHCGIYGLDNSVQALENLYGVAVDYYLQINFTGFETLVDAIGGITVYSDTEFDAWTNKKVHIKEGENQLNGKQALAFARERYALTEGDNDRGKNQMKVIKAIVDKVVSESGSMLLNYNAILDSLQGMFVTSMPPELISELVKLQISESPKWEVQSFAVKGTGSTNTTYSSPSTAAYVMLEDKVCTTYAASLIGRVVNGEVLPEEALELTDDTRKGIEEQLKAQGIETTTPTPTAAPYNPYYYNYNNNTGGGTTSTPSTPSAPSQSAQQGASTTPGTGGTDTAQPTAAPTPSSGGDSGTGGQTVPSQPADPGSGGSGSTPADPGTSGTDVAPTDPSSGAGGSGDSGSGGSGDAGSGGGTAPAVPVTPPDGGGGGAEPPADPGTGTVDTGAQTAPAEQTP